MAVIHYLGVLQDPGFIAAAGREGERNHCRTCNPKTQWDDPPQSQPPHEDGCKYTNGSPGAFNTNPARSTRLGRWMMHGQQGRKGGWRFWGHSYLACDRAALQVQRAVLAMQHKGKWGPQDLGPHPTGVPHPPGLSPDVHEVFIHAPGCLGCHGHRDPVFLQREEEQRGSETVHRENQPLPAPAPAGISPKAQLWPPTRWASMSLTLANNSSHHEGCLGDQGHGVTGRRRSPGSTPGTPVMAMPAGMLCAFPRSSMVHSPRWAPQQEEVTWGQNSPEPSDALQPTQD